MNQTFTVETAKVVGAPAGGLWSQVHTFFPDGLKKEKRGDLLAVLVVRGVSEGIEAISAGREVLGRIHEEFYGNLEGDVFTRLGEAVQKVGRENEGLTIVAASVFKNALYLAILGAGQAWFKRKEKLGMILRGGEGLQTGSGLIEEGDVVLLGSETFFKTVAEGVLRASLESNSPAEAVEVLAPIILGRQDTAEAAVALALIKEKEKEELAGPSLSELDLKEVPPESGREKKKKINLPIFNRLIARLNFSSDKMKIFIRRPKTGRRQRNLFLVLLFLLGILVLRRFFWGEGGIFSNWLKKERTEIISPEESREKSSAESEKEISLAEIPIFMDLNLISAGARGDAFSLLEKKLAILDSSKKKVYFLDIEKKAYEIADLSGEGKLITLAAGGAYIFSPEGIFKIQPKTNSVLKISADDSWKSTIDMAVFAGNLYLLDKEGDIWRYLGTGESFGPKKSWFLETAPDLSLAVSMTIDGSIWVLTKDNILKFTLGKKDNFALTKMPESFSEPVKIYTSAKEENLYVLDKGQGKILVINKNGEFRGSYVWQGVKQTTDLVALESMKKIFLLSGQKIYEMEIK